MRLRLRHRARSSGSSAALGAIVVVIVVVIVMGMVAGCSDDDGATPEGSVLIDRTADPTLTSCDPVDPVLLVDQLDDAVAAVEAELGGAQEYFEMNATSQVVNLFVASADGSQATAYVWLDGELSAGDTSSAQGNTFPAATVAFDPALVTACVTAQLPESRQDVFVVEGGVGGVVRYSVVVTSAQGGQLVVEVGGDGGVVAVDTT